MTSKIIENERIKLSDQLLDVIPRFERVSIATGYWDLPGFQILESALSQYKEVRLLIGQEPLPPAYLKKLDINDLDASFPEQNMIVEFANRGNSLELRSSANAIKQWILDGRLEVKVMRGRFLHAKAYIFGDYTSAEAIGVIGSSNFTAAGLTKNLELNALEDNSHTVVYQPQSDLQPHGHLSWFDSLWNSQDAELWNGKFTEIIDASPLGDLMFSEYHMYVKALYEIYGDELVDEINANQSIDEVLYEFQRRNANLLMKKLEKNGVAILADSVGLGKTITAGAVVKRYIDDLDASRVYVIAPAALTQQWKTELAENFKLVSGFQVISLQDARKIAEARELDKYAPVDLFVLDEAHNLRSGHGVRFDELLEWFSDNPDSHVLMLTATPINNSLKDLKNQIQLGAKGRLDSFPVVYPTSSGVEVIDFYEAIERLNKEIKTAVKRNEPPDYHKVNDVMRQGLRHFMVRTTRHGIEKEFGGITTSDGTLLKFPTSENQPRGYSFDPGTLEKLREIVIAHKDDFEGIDVHDVDVRWLLDLTQRAEHPLETLKKDKKHSKVAPTAPFEAVFQLLLLLGFAPYKYEIYRRKYHGEQLSTIASKAGSPKEKAKIASQLSIHNMLRVTFLKRLESSQHALRISLSKFRKRLIQFESLLDRGLIARVKDVGTILDEFGDDDTAITDVDWENLPEVEAIPADDKVFNIVALRADLQRDHKILDVLEKLCDVLAGDDDKLSTFATLLEELAAKSGVGKKVLVFSYFADTVDYLKNHLPSKVSIENFAGRSAFVAGSSKSNVNDFAKRFSPKSKKASESLMALGEIDYLIATDVLSEGQNLQDCGVIVNYDLHWNPVRMIQRNGRINRLGSEFDTVNIFNMHPDENLNAYLTLVERLQIKIDQIKFSIGTDQSVLGEEANPMEFVDIYDPEKANAAIDGFDDDEQFLSEDEFVQDLRFFHKSATNEDKRIVSTIGLGKWGRLPSGFAQHIPSVDSLSLVRVTSENSADRKSTYGHLFVQKHDKFGAVEIFRALAAIRTSPGNVERSRDNFNLNRDEVSKKVVQVARAKIKQAAGFFKFTRTVHIALDLVKASRPDIDLATAFARVTTRQTKKKASTLVRLVNAEHKLDGSLSAELIIKIEAFVALLTATQPGAGEANVHNFEVVLNFGQ